MLSGSRVLPDGAMIEQENTTMIPLNWNRWFYSNYFVYITLNQPDFKRIYGVWRED